MNNPLFSVLIANYNNGIYIEDAIQSIFDQTYNNWEIIIVDDFSTDSSSDAYDNYQKNEKIKVFRNTENKRCGYTKRRCVDEASGVICGFLDPDDILSKDALAEMIAAHEQNPDCSLVHSK
ncbi:glycosyltransferase, partial [Dysgonomonas mossii]|uniref:glycosyltransferase n=2 Tax=Dysgonomonas TaxID=156973 RepID=UPI001ACEC81B